jgi:type VI protein secretion system component Hcp
MSDETTKEGTEDPEETKSAELSNEDLERASGGALNDSFLNLGGIKGESTDKDHKDWVTFRPLNPNTFRPRK